MDAILANLLGWCLQVAVVVAGAAAAAWMMRVDAAAGAPCVVAYRARRVSGAADPAAMARGEPIGEDRHRRQPGASRSSIHRSAIPLTAHRC